MQGTSHRPLALHPPSIAVAVSHAHHLCSGPSLPCLAALCCKAAFESHPVSLIHFAAPLSAHGAVNVLVRIPVALEPPRQQAVMAGSGGRGGRYLG